MIEQKREIDGRTLRRRSMEVFDETIDRLAALADTKRVPMYGLLDAIVNAACDAYEREFGPLNPVPRRHGRVVVNDADMLAAMNDVPAKKPTGRKAKNHDNN